MHFRHSEQPRRLLRPSRVRCLCGIVLDLLCKCTRVVLKMCVYQCVSNCRRIANHDFENCTDSGTRTPKPIQTHQRITNTLRQDETHAVQQADTTTKRLCAQTINKLAAFRAQVAIELSPIL
jgi:hypothetical protein